MMRRLALTALAGICASACLLFTSLDDLSGGADADAGGGTATDGASGADGRTDGGGTTTIDAAPNDGANTANGRPCSLDTGDVFCASFDVGALADGWDSLSQPNGTMALEENASFSPPRSALANLESTGTYIQGPFLQKNLVGPITTLSCSIAFRRDVVGTSPTTFFQLIAFFGGNDAYTAQVTTGTTAGDFSVNRYVDGGNLPLRSATAPVAFPIGEWHIVTIMGDAQNVHLLVDGAEVAALAHDFTVPSAGARIRVGLFDINSGAATSWSVHYDDVRCTATQ
jgi:hypothetical protein